MSDVKSLFLNKASEDRRAASLAVIRGALLDDGAKDVTIGKILDDLQGAEGAGRVMYDDFRSITVTELRTMLASTTADKPRQQKAKTPEVPVPNWSPEVRAQHEVRVLEFLTEKGLGEGAHARGFTPHDLRQALTGTEVQMREVLKSLEDAKKVVSTGDTKGKRYVVKSLAAKAEAAAKAFKAEKDKAEAEKAERKAKAEAEGKTVKGGRKPKTA